jgi:hypothetical protein
MFNCVICLKRSVLERAVLKAAQAVYSAKPEDRGPLRRNGRVAVKALHQHVKEHGCEEIKTAPIRGPWGVELQQRSPAASRGLLRESENQIPEYAQEFRYPLKRGTN